VEEMTIGEIAQMAGLQTSTLRYYESIGILPPPRRVSGQRRYSLEILQILAVIQLAKEANFTLPEIRALLYDYSEYSTPSERWKQLARRKLHEVDEMIRRAQEMKQLLEEGLESEALLYELDSCALLVANMPNSLSETG
jgi:MerR family transcriptional regulator, redox-sensitive transcriptional activator SoxR